MPCKKMNRLLRYQINQKGYNNEQNNSKSGNTGGKPIIKGTRISVEFILELLASDVTETEILQDYPHLSKEDINACLRYAANSLKNDIYPEPEAA